MDMMTILVMTGVIFLVAAVSYAAFIGPMIIGSNKKKRVEEVVYRKRKSLIETRDKREKEEKNVAAKDTIAALFKVQKLAGQMGEKIRDKCLQAGYRSPNAPLTFLSLKVILPVIFTVFTMLVLALKAEPLPGALGPLILIGCALFGFYLPGILLKNQKIKRQQEIALSFPDSLDMILICVQGGIGIEQAIDRVSKEVAEHSRVLAEELGILSAELSMLNDRKKAFSDFARRVGSGAARSFATTMVQAEQYGTSISQAMRVLAEDQRDQRMAEAEKKAASLPPKLTVPMILFFLPALFIVILGPAAIQAMMLH